MIENKSDFILSVVLCALWLVSGIALLFTNFWVLGIVLTGCGAYSFITPAKYYVSQRNTAHELAIDEIEVGE